MLLLCTTLGWCYFETLAFMDTRGNAVGFHPNVIGAIPFAFLVSLALILFAYFKKSLAVAACSILPIILLGLPIYYSYQISIYGWSNEIHARSDINAMAIDNTDFSTAHFDYVPYKDHERMTEVVGFQWSNADERTGAKNGVFLGFVVNSVPHVYICPLMNGARGVAWVTAPASINNDPSVRYEYTGVANWYIWTL